VVIFTARPPYPQGLDRRLGETQSRSARGGEQKNFKPLPGLELPIIQPVAQLYTTELSQLVRDIIHRL
jgi:hypothetical protein